VGDVAQWPAALMVAYSFQRRFAEPILDGRKGGTIRAARKWRYGPGPSAEIGGHAYPGRELQLYTGMRTKQCRLIARKTCVAVEPITLNFVSFGVGYIICGARCLRRQTELDAFAAFDGFQSFTEMAEFWAETHAADKFHGWHIRWLPLPSN
jgi:hypothetical protein